MSTDIIPVHKVAAAESHQAVSMESHQAASMESHKTAFMESHKVSMESQKAAAREPEEPGSLRHGILYSRKGKDYDTRYCTTSL